MIHFWKKVGFRWVWKTKKYPSRRVHFLLQKNTGNDERQTLPSTQEEARMFRRKFITYEQAEVIYSISHRKIRDMNIT